MTAPIIVVAVVLTFEVCCLCAITVPTSRHHISCNFHN